jgi:hypothetical protein
MQGESWAYRILIQSNCHFPSLADGRELSFKKSFAACRSACLQDHLCIAFSYNEEDDKCILPHKSTEFKKETGGPYFSYLFLKKFFELRAPIFSSSSKCAVVTTRIWKTDSGGTSIYQSNCEFRGFDIEEPQHFNSYFECEDQCIDNINGTHNTY